MADKDKDRQDPQDQVPKPPTDKEVEEISRAQEYITDDWTGEGGKPKEKPRSRR